MKERVLTKVYHFSVEGETEKWYLVWLQELINAQSGISQRVSFRCSVKNPLKHAKAITALGPLVITHFQDYESNEVFHVQKWKGLLDSLADVKKLKKRILYQLAYSNYTFELWILLHKGDCAGSMIDRTKYLLPLNRLYEESFENLDQYKHEDNFRRVLNKMDINDVKTAITRAERIMQRNTEIGHLEIEYRGYSYYRENPSLSIHLVIKQILVDCGCL